MCSCFKYTGQVSENCAHAKGILLLVQRRAAHKHFYHGVIWDSPVGDVCACTVQLAGNGSNCSKQQHNRCARAWSPSQGRSSEIKFKQEQYKERDLNMVSWFSYQMWSLDKKKPGHHIWKETADRSGRRNRRGETSSIRRFLFIFSILFQQMEFSKILFKMSCWLISFWLLY